MEIVERHVIIVLFFGIDTFAHCCDVSPEVRRMIEREVSPELVSVGIIAHLIRDTIQLVKSHIGSAELALHFILTDQLFY